MSRALAALALLALLAAAAAPAGARELRGERVVRSLKVAERMWGPAPGCERVTVDRRRPPVATWTGWTYPGRSCVIYVRRGRWYRHDLCSTILHEYGHLAGYRDPSNTADPLHSLDPDHPMYAFEGEPDWRCIW